MTKKSMYIPEPLMAEIEQQARRLERNVSWIVQRAWLLARDRIAEYPSVDDFDHQGDTH